MQRDLVVSFLSSLPPAVAAKFPERPLQLVCPVTQAGGRGYPGGRPGYQQWIGQFRGADGAVIPGMFQAAGGSASDTIGRVCIMGFSNGCIGVDELLGAADSPKIDTVLAIDGLHGAYANLPEGGRGLFAPAYKRYLNHGAHVVQYDPDRDLNAPVMVISHSSIVPPDFPSTTETGAYVWDGVWSRAPAGVPTLRCGYPCAPVAHATNLAAVQWPAGHKICTNGCFIWSGFADGWYDRRFAGNFAVLGWGDAVDGKMRTRDPAGTADHIFQGHAVLPALLEEYVVKRWNASCGVVAATAGLGQPVACEPGRGVVYDHSDAGKVDYFPDIPDAAPVPPGCAAPRPGYVVVGSETDPCATLPIATVAYEDRGHGWDLTAWLALAAGAAGGYLVGRHALPRLWPR